MGRILRGVGMLVAALALATAASAQQNVDPPGRVGRVAFINGTVSFHDRDQTDWEPAALNYPLTSGDALWTEPNGRAEVFVAATRLRMQGSTQLETLSLTDDEFRLRIAQGRVDAKTAGLGRDRQVEVLTPRATVMLVGDGDYMIEAGTTEDATRVGVRAGSARVIAPGGTELVVRAGEIGVLTGTSPPVFETVRMATPPMPPEWAQRDRQIAGAQSVQYVPAGMTGVEELDYHGTWSTVGDYGRVWSPRTVPAGWAPYRQGRWRWVDPWGWTWVDDQPWGFAPSHYGRWVNQGGRWYWVPPARQSRPVYAPAVVGFVDIAAAGAALAIGSAAVAPVGWFPLGPREVYVPPYTANRTYIRNVNVTNVYNVVDIDRRIEYVERRRDPRYRDDARRDGRRDDGRDRPLFVNQRYATVVPQQVFMRGERVDRAAIRVAPDRLARAQAAPVAAPLVMPSSPPQAAPGKPPAPDARPGQPPRDGRDGPGGVDVRRAPLADIPVLGRPDRADRRPPNAPGPQITRAAPAPDASSPPAGPLLPGLRTRDGRDADRGGPPPAAAPAADPARPGDASKPDDRRDPPPPARPDERARPPQASPPGFMEPAKPAEPKAAQPPAPPPPPGAAPRPAEPNRPPATPPRAADPQKPLFDQPRGGEPPRPPQGAEPPKPPAAQPRAGEPARPVPPPQARPPESPRPAPPPQARPPEAPRPAPPPQAKPPESPRPAPPPQARPPESPRPAPPPQARPPESPRPAPPPQARPPEPPRAPPPAAAPRPAEPPRQAAPPQRPPEQGKPPGRDRDDKGGDDRRR